MTEMERVRVPLVRDWLTPALRDMTRTFYGRRGFFFVLWWPFFLVFVFYSWFKMIVYLGVVAVMLAAFAVWAVAELLTYRRRLRWAQAA